MIAIQTLNPKTWTDFVALMQTDRQCAECWCLNHRAAVGCATGAAAQAEMRELVLRGEVGGLLAYHGEICVGWISVDPMEKMIGHDCLSSGKPGEWAIHCIYVRDGYRGKGVSTEMIRAAIEFAKTNGATLVSAFPIPQANRGRFPVGEAEFSGRFSTYSKLGFMPAGDASDFYQRVELGSSRDESL